MTANPITTEELQKLMDAAGGPFGVKVMGEVATIFRGDDSEAAFCAFGNFGIGERSKATMALLAMSHKLAAELITARAKLDAAHELAAAFAMASTAFSDLAEHILDNKTAPEKINWEGVFADLQREGSAARAAISEWRAAQ